MKHKSKMRRRLVLLAALAVVVVIGVLVFVYGRAWRRSQFVDGLRRDGLAAAQAKDYPRALEKLGRYLQRAKDRGEDPDVLRAFGEARQHVPALEGHHIRDAIHAYQRYLAVRADDRQVRHELIELYNAAGLFNEAADAAQKLRPERLADGTPADAATLREEATALIGLKQWGERLTQVLDRAIELEPGSLEGHLLRLDYYAKADRAREAADYTRALLAREPGKAEYRLLSAMSGLLQPTPESLQESHETLCALAGLDPRTARRVGPAAYASTEVAQRIVLVFDRLGAFDHSLATLEDAADRMPDAAVEQLLVRRLWESGEFARIVARKVPEPTPEPAPAEILGFRALALRAVGRNEDASAIPAELESRVVDYSAQGWALALRATDPKAADAPDEAMRLLREAIVKHPYEPAFAYFQGEFLDRLGRVEEARQAWRTAVQSPVSAGWATPRIRSAQSLLNEGRVVEACALADEARQVAPTKLASNQIWVESHAARIESGRGAGPDPAAVLAHAKAVRAAIAGASQSEGAADLAERLLAPIVLLESRVGGKPAGVRALREILDDPAPLGVGTLQRLAAVSEREGLGLEAACLERSKQAHGETLGTALTRAIDRGKVGEASAGLEELRRAAAAEPANALAWELAMARYMDLFDMPEATKALATVADANPDSLSIQRTVIEASSAGRDRALVERCVERYRKLSGVEEGKEPVSVRVARARAILGSSPTRRDYDGAVELLRGVVAQEPASFDARAVLGRALAAPIPGVEPNIPGAIEQLSAAINLRPGAWQAGIELAYLLSSARRSDEAIEILEPIASDAAAPDSTRAQAATMLAAQGRFGPASAALEAIALRLGERTPPRVLLTLAQCRGRMGDDAGAREIFQRLSRAELASAELVLEVAEHFAATGDAETAARVLVRLDALPIPDVEKLITRGRFAERFGSGADTEALYRRAIAAAPGSADPWRALITSSMRRGDFIAAKKAADEARAALPDDATIERLARSASLAAEGTDELVWLTPLMQIETTDPAEAQASRILAAVSALRDAGKLDSAEELVKLSGEFPASMPLQMFTADRLLRLSPPSVDEALAIVQRAIKEFPGEPAPPRAAARILARVQRWADLVTVAQAWREQDPSNRSEATVAIAEAYANLGRHTEALRELEPLLAGAAETPEGVNLGVLNIAARSLVATEQTPKARSLLEPLLASPLVRVRVWLDLASRQVRDGPTALDWVLAAERASSIDSPEDQMALAAAEATIASRLPDVRPTALTNARARLERLTARPDASAGAWEYLALVCQQAEDLGTAEAAYRKAIAADPARVASLNNLAFMLVTQGRSLEEAAELARRAVAGDPRPAFLDTLAQANLALARTSTGQGAKRAYAEAASALERLHKLDPKNPAWAFGLASALELGEEPGKAMEVYERLLRDPTLGASESAAARNNLAYLILTTSEDSESIARAMTLSQAATMRPDAPAAFWDTRARAEERGGDRAAAIKSFRTALDRDPKFASALIGLARILSAGSEPERAEARTLIDRVEALTEPLAAHQAEELRLAKVGIDGPG